MLKCNYGVPVGAQAEIRRLVIENATFLRKLPHGGEIYDLDGQNLCLSNCLTRSIDSEDQRQLIFFPNGRLQYDWTFEGSVLLNGE